MSGAFQLEAVQEALQDAGMDGWLFAQFHGRDPVANRVLGLDPSGLQTRRWFYLVPASGEPRGLVHAIESQALDALPGDKTRYRTWGELEDGLKGLLRGVDRLAMQYSPQNRIPAVAIVDAGTVELVRELGSDVVSSADLVQRFTAALDDNQIESHRYAAGCLPQAINETFCEVRRRILSGEEPTEFEVQQFLLARVTGRGLHTEGDAPIVAVNANASDPHYAPTAERTDMVRRGDWLLIDVWAKRPEQGSVFADITWTAQVDATVPDARVEVFETVRRARDAAVTLVRERYADGAEVAGFEPDQAARGAIEAAGYGHAIQHRTGHSITDEIHGAGANLDDFESHDERRLLRRTCFSVEPGVYLGEFGVRSEVNVLIPSAGEPEVTGLQQQEVVLLLGDQEPRLPEDA